MSIAEELGIDMGKRPEDMEREAEGPSVPPPGKYHAVLKGAKAADFESGSSGNEFEFEILAPAGVEGRTVRDRLFVRDENGNLNEKTKSRRHLYAARLGLIRWEGDEKTGRWVGTDKKDFLDAIGTEVVIEVEHEEYTRKKDGKKGVSAKVTYSGIWAVDDPRVADVPKAEASAAAAVSTKAKSDVVKGDDLDDI